MQYFLFCAFILVAWFLHIFLARIYEGWFSSVGSFRFRIVHALEIFITISLFVFIYQAISNAPMSEVQGVVVALVLLIVVDSALLLLYKRIRSEFDIFHFIVAYTVITAAIIFQL